MIGVEAVRQKDKRQKDGVKDREWESKRRDMRDNK